MTPELERAYETLAREAAAVVAASQSGSIDTIVRSIYRLEGALLEVELAK